MEEINIIRKVEAIISAGEEIPITWLRKRERGRNYIAITRQMIMYFSRVNFNVPYVIIGNYYDRGHDDAMHAEKVINDLCLYDKEFKAKIDRYSQKLADGMPGLYNLNVIKVLQDGVKSDYNDLKRRFDEIGELIKKVMPHEIV